jgi:predicted nucleic acid-binding protein
LILVDTSVWIDFFNSAAGRSGFELERLIRANQSVAITGVVLCEILQGITRNASQIEQFLTKWHFVEPQGFETYRRAAAICREGRAQGFTFTTMDCVIAAVALEHAASLFTLDKDFTRIAALTGLMLHPLPRTN